MYDRDKMQYKEQILRFTWGEYQAIGIQHFEQRRDDRIKNHGTDIFDETNLTDKEVLLTCFQILKVEKYDEIISIIDKNKPKHTQFIVAFETDEITDNGKDFLFIFIVFAISIKETAMNGIKKGEKALICITVVKDSYKIKKMIPSNTLESSLCYYRDKDGGDYRWENTIPRK